MDVGEASVCVERDGELRLIVCTDCFTPILAFPRQRGKGQIEREGIL